MFSPRTILYPTDFSEPSRAAFDIACSLARDYDARLIVAHVRPPTRVVYTPGIPIVVEPEPREEAWNELQRIRPANPAVRAEHRLLEGEAVPSILWLAEKEGCDLIVIGTHGRTGLNRVIMGSVAEGVSRGATCPVLTVRAPATTAEPAPAAETRSALA